jgi:hypothetical protein
MPILDKPSNFLPSFLLWQGVQRAHHINHVKLLDAHTSRRTYSFYPTIFVPSKSTENSGIYDALMLSSRSVFLVDGPVVIQTFLLQIINLFYDSPCSKAQEKIKVQASI